MVYYRRAVWKPAPALSCPMPHLFDMELPRRFKVRLAHQAIRKIQNIGGPDPARDNPLINPCGGDDENVPAHVTSNEPRNGSAFSKSPTMQPLSKLLKHV